MKRDQTVRQLINDLYSFLSNWLTNARLFLLSHSFVRHTHRSRGGSLMNSLMITVEGSNNLNPKTSNQ